MSIIELQQNIEEMPEYEPLPDGPYRAEVQHVDHKVNEKTPTGFLTVQLKVAPDSYPADYDPANAPEGVIVTIGYLALPTNENRRAVAPFNNFLKAIAVKAKGSSFNSDDWIGRECQVTLTRGEFQGALLNNVVGYGPLPTV